MSSIKSEEGKTNMRNYIKKGRFNQNKSHFTRKSFASVQELSNQPLRNKLLNFKDSLINTPKLHDSSPSVNSERNRMIINSLNPDQINIPGSSKISYSMNKQKINIEKIENLE